MMIGLGIWANGHLCGLRADEGDKLAQGSIVSITEDPHGLDDPVNMLRWGEQFVVTPQVIIHSAGSHAFCGARGMWSDIYYRQPDAELEASRNALEGQQ